MTHWGAVAGTNNNNAPIMKSNWNESTCGRTIGSNWKGDTPWNNLCWQQRGRTEQSRCSCTAAAVAETIVLFLLSCSPLLLRLLSFKSLLTNQPAVRPSIHQPCDRDVDGGEMETANIRLKERVPGKFIGKQIERDPLNNSSPNEWLQMSSPTPPVYLPPLRKCILNPRLHPWSSKLWINPWLEKRRRSIVCGGGWWADSLGAYKIQANGPIPLCCCVMFQLQSLQDRRRTNSLFHQLLHSQSPLNSFARRGKELQWEGNKNFKNKLQLSFAWLWDAKRGLEITFYINSLLWLLLSLSTHLLNSYSCV